MMIHIRKVEEADIECMTRYRIEYLTEMQGERDRAYKNRLLQELSSFFRDAIARGEFVGMMAEEEGQPLSFGGMVIKRIPGDFNQASYTEADILNMYTIPAARRRGISTAILDALKNEAISMGISKLALHASAAGEPLYRRFGFNDPVYPVLELPL
jgi:GNAT superfamily N-acetyltransferase